jgi:hypothetical protein
MSEFTDELCGQIKQQFKRNVIVASDGLYQEHPEAYRPRVFCHAEQDGKTYELLQDGQAIPWPKAPDPKTCGFDFWVVEVIRLGNLKMRRSHE